jgi:hypothetical protein
MLNKWTAIVEEHGGGMGHMPRFEAYCQKESGEREFYREFSAMRIGGHFVLFSRESPQESGVTGIVDVVHDSNEVYEALHRSALGHARMLQWNYSTHGVLSVPIVDKSSRAKEGELAKAV